MRILLSTDTVGGVWEYAALLSRLLVEEGHHVLLAVVGEPTEERLSALPANVQVASRAAPLEWMPGADAELEPTATWLADLATGWRADVVHLNQMAYSAHRFPAPVLVVVHSDVVSWFSEVRGEAPPPEWDRYRERIRAGLRGADVLVAPSSYQAELTRRAYGRGADRVIHNAAAAPPVNPPPRAEPLLLTVGRAWDDAKGIVLIDQALEELGELAPPAHLLGDTLGAQGQRVKPRNVVCHGAADRRTVEAWMRRATLYVGASLYEPFGLAPAEAAMHGCTLVLSDIGSFRELWDGCAQFFRSGDPASLADAIAAACEPQRGERLASLARGRALERFGVERFVAEYQGLYSGMCGVRSWSDARQATLAL